MTAPGLLDFFVLEASEYLEQLDALLAGGAVAPDLDAVQKSARSLRGSATMSKLAGFAELAGAVERVSRAARDGTPPWDRALGAAVVSAIDELKILLHAARKWTDAETGRARTRAAELLALLPAEATAAPPSASTSTAFLANETANIAAGLEFLLTAPGGGGAAGVQVLQRVRALRGIAAIRDVPVLPDTLEAAEQGAASLEQGRLLGAEQRSVLRAAATLLRELAQGIRGGRTVGQEALAPVEQALDRWLDHEDGSGEMVVPIATLFHDDAGPHLLTVAANPPTTAAERFRLERVSNGEHLRVLVEEARTADPLARERYRRHVRRSLRAIRRTAESFGELDVARAIDRVAADVSAVDDRAVGRLMQVAQSLATAGDAASVVAALDQSADPPAGAAAEPATPSRAVPGAAPESAAVPEASPAMASAAVAGGDERSSGHPPRVEGPPMVAAEAQPMATEPSSTEPSHEATSLAEMLSGSASALDAAVAMPLVAPVTIAETPVVAIETLVYRGKAALRRALELRDEMREGGAQPDAAAVAELFDLIELALVD